ncbi:MAG TPA: LytTR family DNA-binding domain-containing protein [Chitinophaga sp.]|jgi:DNA-binding LytR/AlgR family response regulator|uniref:LytR/AlgR family response regulator transcription factor n=1 Tax=Chitinophaga sp. TaxID=1869181 RepID=UPI002DBDDAE8|nr:LytTR family DNA-binding domain-containing protein [Chitinophaga sp.]HEU4555005.1 LytTR family DNA-binding domain-containing protein [Chitinophaga sp.]
MISCYIVDDEQHAIQVMAKHIEQTPGLQLIGTSENPLEALQVFRENGYADITFIDIDMPQLSGMDLSELLHNKTTIVFATAYDKYALQAFEKSAFDYILKPISYERFLKCINKLNSRMVKGPQEEESSRDHFYIQYEMKGKIVKIEYKDVVYIQALKNYVIIHTVNGKFITYLTMKEMEDSLSPSVFMRVHKSFIVNLTKVQSIDGNAIQLGNKTEITLGISYKEAFFARLNEKMIKTKRLSG